MILLQLILVKGTLSIAYVPKRSKLSFHYIFFLPFWHSELLLRTTTLDNIKVIFFCCLSPT